MLEPHMIPSNGDRRVQRALDRYHADPLALRLLKRLWLTPNQQHRSSDLAAALNVGAAPLRRSLRTLVQDGLALERRSGDESRYCVASNLSAHWLISQVLSRDTRSAAELPPRH